MRDAPDAQVVLEIAARAQPSGPTSTRGIEALAERVSALERGLDRAAAAFPRPLPPTPAAAEPPAETPTRPRRRRSRRPSRERSGDAGTRAVGPQSARSGARKQAERERPTAANDPGGSSRTAGAPRPEAPHDAGPADRAAGPGSRRRRASTATH